MNYQFRPTVGRVNDRGAAAGSVLCGAVPNNQGLRLRVLQEQPRGRQGPVEGRFVLLDAGDNKHSGTLAALLHRETDAEEVLGAIRRQSPGCVNVANTQILTVEQSEGAGP